MTAQELIETEERIVNHWNSGDVNALTHMSLSDNGEHEEWLCRFYDMWVRPQDWIFASHRCHFHALLSSAYTPDQLVERVLNGHSMSCYGPRFVTSAIVAGVCGIAAGRALAMKEREEDAMCFCFVGDGAMDQGAFAEAVRFVDGRELPCMFIVENNNSSCGVTMEQRGMKPFQWPGCVIEKHYRLKYGHAGTNVRPNLKSQKPYEIHATK